MNYKFLILFLTLIAFSCGKQGNSEVDQDKIAGYWEIKTVQFQDGTEKNFDVNLVVDHIEVEGDKGFRIKMEPQLDGSFITNAVAEDFTLREENDSLHMFYKTPYAEWKETVLEANEETLKVINHEKRIFIYSRYENHPFDLDE